MIKTVIRTGAAMFALTLAAAAMFPGWAIAQSNLPCSGHASIVNGQVIVDNLTPAGGVDSQCEVLVMPGGVAVQNGGSTKANDGVNATHAGAGGGHSS